MKLKNNLYPISTIFFIIFYVAEFLIVYNGDIPTGVLLNFQSRTAFLQSQFNVVTEGGALTSNIYAIEVLFMYVFGESYFSTIQIVFFFFTSTLGSFISSKYFIRKYVNSNNSFYPNQLIDVTSFLIGVIYPLNFYIFGGLGSYSMFYATIPITIMILDKYIPQKKNINIDNIMLSALLISIGMSMSIYETRTIIYVSLFSFVFFLFIILAERKNISLKNTTFTMFLSFMFLLALNLRTVLVDRYLLTNGGFSILYNATSSQLGISYQNFPIKYILSGSVIWNFIYNPNLYFIGLIPFILAIFSLSNKKGLKISIFFLILVIALVIFTGTLVGYNIRYFVGQTYLSSYLPILYPTYLLSILFIPFLFVPFSLGFYYLVYSVLFIIDIIFTRIKTCLIEKNADILNDARIKQIKTIIKKQKYIKFASVFIIFILIVSPILYYDSNNISSVQMYYKTVNVPNYLSVAESIITRNDTGIVYIMGNSSSLFNSLENNLTISTSWYSYISAYPQYLIDNHIPMLSKTLSLLGVQYILLYDENANMVKYFNSSEGLKSVYSTLNVHLYLNSYYKPFEISHTGLYIGYNMPLILNYVARSNISSPILPFYDINNFSKIEPYIKGFIGINLTANEVVPLFSNNCEYNFSSFSINEYPAGWQKLPLFWAGDAVTGLIPTSTQTLSVHLNHIQKGKYYLYLEGGIAALNSYHTTGSSTLTISSGSSVNVYINENSYAPTIGIFSGGLIEINNSSLKINATIKNGIPMVNDVYLIPQNIMNELVLNTTKLLKKVNVVDYLTPKKLNYSTHLLSGDFARWYVSIPENYLRNSTGEISLVHNLTLMRQNITGINYALDGNMKNDNGKTFFEFNPIFNNTQKTINNTAGFSSYSASPNSPSLAYVNISNVKYLCENSVYLPALPKIGSVSLWTNKSFGNNITVNLKVMSNNFGENPGIVINNILMDFSGRLNGGFPNYSPFKLDNGVWYNVYVSISGSYVNMYISKTNSYGPIYGVSYNLEKYNLTASSSPIGIRSDNGELYFSDLRVLNYSINNASLFSPTPLNNNSSITFNNIYQGRNGNVTVPITLLFEQPSSINDVVNTEFELGGKILESYLSSIDGNFFTNKNENFSQSAGTEIISYEHYQFVQDSFQQTFKIDKQILKYGFYYGSYFVYVSSQNTSHLVSTINENEGFILSDYNLLAVILILAFVAPSYFIRKKNENT